MKHCVKLIIILSIILMIAQSCVVEPKLPSVNLIVNNHTKFKIDSLCVSSDSSFNKDNSDCYVDFDFTDNLEAYLTRGDSLFRIKIILDNSQVYISDKQIKKTNNYDGFIVDIDNDGLKITNTNSFLIKHYILLIIYITLLNILFKSIIYLYVTKPTKKLIYLIKFTLLSDLILLIIYFVNNYLIIKNGLSPLWILPLGFLISVFSDFYYHKLDNNVTIKNNTKTFVITNLLYFTIGLFLALMFYMFVIDK